MCFGARRAEINVFPFSLGIAHPNAEAEAVVALETAIEIDADDIMHTQRLNRERTFSSILCMADGEKQHRQQHNQFLFLVHVIDCFV